MKKIILVLAAFFCLASSVYAGNQSSDDDATKIVVPNYDKMKAYLSLDEGQSKSVYSVMQQMYDQLNIIYNQIEDSSIAKNHLNIVITVHKRQMMDILSADQYLKYEPLFNSIVKNYSDKYE